MSTVADRIAGRDLDREAFADRLDDLLEEMSLHGTMGRGLLTASDEVLLTGTEIDRSEAAGRVTEGLRLDVRPVGSVTACTLMCDAEPGSAHVGIADGLYLEKWTACGPARIARRFGVSKSRVPDEAFLVEYRVSRPIDMGDSVMPATWAYARSGSELWRFDAPTGDPVLDRGRPLKDKLGWVLRVGDVGDGRVYEPKHLSGGSFKAMAAVRHLKVRRFTWAALISHPGMPSTFVECSPEGARALFADRNVVGGKRRTALRHWVKEHYRRGHTPEESHKVREHLRGIERFTWHGLDVKLQVPSAEIEAAGLLARSGR